MASRLERRLRTVTYQFLKTYPEAATLSAEARVRIVQKIFDTIINSGVTFEEPSLFKREALGVELTWSDDGTRLTMKRDNIEVEDDLTDTVVEEVAESENAAYIDESPWEILVGGSPSDDFLEFFAA